MGLMVSSAAHRLLSCVWKRDDGTALTNDEVKTIEADKVSFDIEFSPRSLFVQTNLLKVLLNKAAKTEALPFRVANRMKLIVKHDIGDMRRLSAHTSHHK